MSSPIGMTRRTISYDEHMDTPMHSPPADLSVNILWKDPVIPQHKFRNSAEVLPCFVCLFVCSLLFLYFLTKPVLEIWIERFENYIKLLEENVYIDLCLEGYVHASTYFMCLSICCVSGLWVNHNSINFCYQEGETYCVKMPTFEPTVPARSPVPVVKAKATSLMSSIMISKFTKHTVQLNWRTFVSISDKYVDMQLT